MFKTGQKVVCIGVERKIRFDLRQGQNPTGLIKNNIYTCGGVYKDKDKDSDLVVFIEELNHSFLANRFRAIDYEFAENILSEIIEQVKIEEIAYT